jgi:hypothetical protein
MIKILFWEIFIEEIKKKSSLDFHSKKVGAKLGTLDSRVKHIIHGFISTVWTCFFTKVALEIYPHCCRTPAWGMVSLPYCYSSILLQKTHFLETLVPIISATHIPIHTQPKTTTLKFPKQHDENISTCSTKVNCTCLSEYYYP